MTEREERAQLQHLRNAAHVDIEDVKAGRMRTFNSLEQLDQHFGAIAEAAIASLHDQCHIDENGFCVWLVGKRRQKIEA
jgi:hypothetical protein